MITSKALTRKDTGNAGITKQINGYYAEEKDDYYTKEKQPSEWYGSLANELGLQGKNVEKQDFANLLGGSFKGETLRDSSYKKKSANDRLGMDFTCNAPKSVSIQALVAGDTRLIQAHNEAVKESLAILEDKAQGRKKINGKSRIETTGKVAIAMFRHDTSREKDPHLHTHSVMMNITKRSDGEYRALHNDEIMRIKAQASQAYQTNLAKKCKELGYDIRINDNGTFDLAHISREQIEKFSVRSKQIENNLAKQGLTRETATKEQRQIANLNTRRNKEVGDKTKTQQGWFETAKKIGLNIVLAPKNIIKQKEINDGREYVDDQSIGRVGGRTTDRNTKQRETEDRGTEKREIQKENQNGRGNDSGRKRTANPNANLDITSTENQSQSNYQPSIANTRTQANAKAHRLHELPGGNVANTATGREVLLSDNTQLELHQQRANGNIGMRWGSNGISRIRAIADAFKVKMGLGQEAIKNLEETPHINDIRTLDDKAKFDEPLTQDREERETLKDMMTYESPTNELKEEWQDLAKQLNINFEPGEAFYEKNDEFAGEKLMAHVIEHLVDKKVDLTEKEIIQETLVKGLGEVNYQEAEQLLKAYVEKGNLIAAEMLYKTADDKIDSQAKTIDQWKNIITKDNTGNITEEFALTSIQKGIDEGRLLPINQRFITPEDLTMEKQILQIMQEGKNSKPALYSQEQATQLLSESTLNEGQKSAAKLIMTTEDRVVGIQGYAGVGKSYTLSETLKHVAAAGGNTHVFAPYGSQVKSLQADGHEAHTVAKLLNSKNLKEQLNENSVIIVDEAGVLPNIDAHKLLKLAEEKNAKLVFLGDTQQTKAISAGKPFDILQTNGMAMATIDDIQRQKGETLRKAVLEAAMDQPQESIKTLEKSVVEVKNREERLDVLVNKYMTIPEEERKTTLIVTGTNEDKNYINQAIRQELGLAGKGIESENLKRVDMSNAELKYAKYYTKGQFIETSSTPHEKSLQKSKLYEVMGRDNQLLIVRDDQGKEIKFNPSKEKMSVYESKIMEISKGDQLRVTKGNAELGTVTGDKLIVEAVSKNSIIAKDEKTNAVYKFDTKEKNHLDHDYSSTVHSSQGLTVDKVLINIDTTSKTTSKEVYYVAVSRAKHEAFVVTDSIDRLPEAIAKGAEKHSAYEMVGKEHKTIESNVEASHKAKIEVKRELESMEI